MAFEFQHHHCTVSQEGTLSGRDFARTKAAALLGEMLYSLMKNQTRVDDEAGALFQISPECLELADKIIPTEIEAYLYWCAQEGTMALECARYWTVGDFEKARPFIKRTALRKKPLWVDFDRHDIDHHLSKLTTALAQQ